MTTHTHHTPGSVSWSDLSTPDLAGAMSFYRELLGWEFTEPDPEMGGYANATRDGALVAGIMPIMAEGQPSAWTTYLATDDAERTLGQVTEHGGSVVSGPHDAADLGRMAYATDPTGASFGLWQAGTHTGFGLTEEPGSPGWFELWSQDHHQANNFYAALFGYDVEQVGDGDTFDYTVLQQGGQMIAGTTALPADAPDASSYWLPYFIVDDTDATAATATGLGGAVLRAPEDSPHGRLAVLKDPFGAQLAVIGMMDQPAGT
ncbi:MAG: VOC family protein [Mycobacteriaceae bacterium]